MGQKGILGYMSEDMVQGCVDRSITNVFGHEPFPDIFMKAAALLYGIIAFHPFNDGNKRTALIGVRILLYFNDMSLRYPEVVKTSL
ncbi:MAG: type II toxin-antitoxin system death-on-curing family toxin [Candidatus Bathyarchaeota archaeon]